MMHSNCKSSILPPHRYEYRWADGVSIKKPIEVSASKYVEYLMDWIEAQLDDKSIFPQKLGTCCLLSTVNIWFVLVLIKKGRTFF
ncbi:hypothetical protein CsSME_00051783 [Camellia sinensis var. sinensis]